MKTAQMEIDELMCWWKYVYTNGTKGNWWVDVLMKTAQKEIDELMCWWKYVYTNGTNGNWWVDVLMKVCIY